MNQSNKKSGFTIVELMLSMSLLAVVLVTIAMIVIQISSIYERGLTLKEVDQAGRAIASEFQQNINSGLPFKLLRCNSAAVTCNYQNDNTSGGRLCIGRYSYIWNYGNRINSVNTVNKYQSPNSNTTIRFVKVPDPNADYCASTLLTSPREVDLANAVELLNVSQHDLAIQGFSISDVSYDPKTGQRLYSISFLLGTNEIGTVIPYNTTTSAEARCRTPRELGVTNAMYCSVNKFHVVIRAGVVK